MHAQRRSALPASQLSRELLEPVLAYFGPHGEFDEETIINEALPPPYLIKKDGSVLFIDPRDAWLVKSGPVYLGRGSVFLFLAFQEPLLTFSKFSLNLLTRSIIFHERESIP